MVSLRLRCPKMHTIKIVNRSPAILTRIVTVYADNSNLRTDLQRS